MKKAASVLRLIASIWLIGIAPGFAREDHGGRGDHGHGAPAPAIGASALGLFLASGVAYYYIRKRRRD